MSHRSTSPPPLSPSSPRATPPPLSLPGLLPSRDKSGASSHTPPPPARTDSPFSSSSTTGQPLQRFPSVGGQTSLVQGGDNLKDMERENSERRFSDIEIALTKLENYARAMKDNNIQITDTRVVDKVAELFGKLPPELQEQVRAELNATIFQNAQEENDTLKKLAGWAIEEILLPICLILLMSIVSLYFCLG